MAPQKIQIKERLSNNEIDLSMSDLKEVPVKEIAVFQKAVSLDLSNNHIKALPDTFASLTHLTKLDLSKNQLSALPDNFGALVKLKYIDLYQNRIQHLPLSFGNLKLLRWLDLKDNPLVPAVAKVAGLCSDAKDCQNCARDVVNFFMQVQEQVACDLENRQKQRQKQLEVNQQKKMEVKKSKKKDKNSTGKKENGPVVRENETKASTPTVEEPLVVEEPGKKSRSYVKLSLVTTLFLFVALFVLTSVKFPYFRQIEDTCVTVFDYGLSLLPQQWQVHLTEVGSFVRRVHDKTGNITLSAVRYLQDGDSNVEVYKDLPERVMDLWQKVIEYCQKLWYKITEYYDTVIS